MQQKKEMIPLMLVDKFVASGWLGLILGTKMWCEYYDSRLFHNRSDLTKNDCHHTDAFWPSAVATPASFTQQMDALCREIGDRGKPKHQELSVDPAQPPKETMLQPQQNSAITPAAVSSHMPLATTDGIGTVAETFIETIMTDLREIRSQVEQQSQRITDELRPPSPQILVMPEQLVAVQARINLLFKAEIITQDEVHLLEDSIADFILLSASVGLVTREMLSVGSMGKPCEHFAQAAKVHVIVALSEGIESDAGFARQLRRKVFA
eukprot:SAG31_NODE_1935_length_6872_cov_11.115163_2_plen_266_part_00